MKIIKIIIEKPEKILPFVCFSLEIEESIE